MTTFYLILEISALLGVIIFPLASSKKVRTNSRKQQLSDLYVNEKGHLEYISDGKDRLPVH